MIMTVWSTFISTIRTLFQSWIYGTSFHRIIARLLYIPTILRLIIKQRLSLNSWYNRIDGTVLLGALPFRSMTKELVEQEKVKSVLSYNQNYELKLFTNSKEEWSKHGVRQYVYNTWDFQPPSIQDIQAGINVIENERQNKRSVYVHCKAGKGRSATVVTCYVIKRYKMVPSDAIDFVERKRPQVSMNKFQRQAIIDFYTNFLQKGE